MNKFNKTFRGYDPTEVNKFLDDIILQIEKIVKESKEKDRVIFELNDTISKYKTLEHTLNTSVINAQENAERLRQIAKQESDMIINESRRNANKIISDSLSRAEKLQYDAELLKKNISLFKKRVRTMLEQQIELVDDLDKDNL
ncbi:MAG: DivIVA domain-containing protein [Bacilli bacterium]|nr:DivIVA domain-containing protein [Bacilli bacterium]